MSQFFWWGSPRTWLKYWRWPLSLFPFSGTASGRTYPTSLGRIVQNQEFSLGGQHSNFRNGLEEERRNLRIGLLIKELRLEKGMTQDQLAREIRTSKSAISRLENHAESITLATLEKVARALGKVVHIELS